MSPQPAPRAPGREDPLTIRRLLLAFPVLVAALVGGLYLVSFLRGSDAPAPVSLTTTSGADTTTSSTGGEAMAGPEGIWTVRSGESFVGYRIDETFLGQNLPNTAVGRTEAVEGSVVIEGTTVTEAELVADLSALRSDESRRDAALRRRGLETAEFPTASFRLLEPVDLGRIPARGETLSLTAVGELTLHGVTRRVEFPIEAAWEGEVIRAVGSLEIALADYQIEPPSVAGSISVEDTGIIEIQLVLERG